MFYPQERKPLENRYDFTVDKRQCENHDQGHDGDKHVGEKTVGIENHNRSFYEIISSLRKMFAIIMSRGE